MFLIAVMLIATVLKAATLLSWLYTLQTWLCLMLVILVGSACLRMSTVRLRQVK